MKKIIVIPNPTKDIGYSVTGAVVKKLSSLGFITYLDEKYRCSDISGVTYYEELPRDIDLIVVIGGDGSVIDASLIALELDVPILGVNLGKVGYMVELDPDKLDTLELLVTGEYKVEDKMLLSVKKITGAGEVVSNRLAVNDIVISHDNYFGIADFRVENEQGDHVHYRADAVILSTPQGSTAYSLSAGGPIISHTLDSITVTPVCPHSFFNRSIVYGADEKISVCNISEEKLNISIDGRLFETLHKDESCIVVKGEKRIAMITFSEKNVFSTLSKKIKSLDDVV